MGIPRIENLRALEPLALLEAAQRIAAQPGFPAVVREVLQTGCEVLGYGRVRFYRAFVEDGVLRYEASEGLQGEEEAVTAVPLDASTILGRTAIGEARLGVFHIRSLLDDEEAPDGLSTCLVPVRLEDTVVGVMVADFPEKRCEIPADLAQALGALIQFAEVAIQRWGLGRLRVQFVASVSHELRTPLTSIKAFCEMLHDGDAGPLTDEQLSFVRRIATGADQLHKIVEDLLELSRLRSETEALNVDQINVKLFLEDTASILQPQANARGIQISVSAPDDLPTLHTDQRRLHQALSNFIDNAIKYSPEGGEVAVAATLRNEKMRLCVTDRGCGIPEQDLKRIFEEFYRCQKGVNGTASEGAGLGLAIVARIADMLGAEIEVDSDLGAGSTFCLSFSLEKQS